MKRGTKVGFSIFLKLFCQAIFFNKYLLIDLISRLLGGQLEKIKQPADGYMIMITEPKQRAHFLPATNALQGGIQLGLIN